MIKVVVTGASGFLGSNIIERLKDNGDVMVYALSSKPIESLAVNVKYLHKDVIYTYESEEVLEDSIVINCAFPRNSTGTGMADGLAYINRLFVACKEYKAKAVINISSQSVYPQKREYAADEKTKVCLESMYAVGKYATELMLESLLSGTDVKFTNIRMASLIGPGFNQRIVNRLTKQALEEHSVFVEQNNRKFGFLDIEDAANGIIKVAKHYKSSWKTIYNLGSKYSYSLIEIADQISSVLLLKKDIKIDVNKSKGDDNNNTSIDASLFYREFCFEPQISLFKSIESILEAI